MAGVSSVVLICELVKKARKGKRKAGIASQDGTSFVPRCERGIRKKVLTTSALPSEDNLTQNAWFTCDFLNCLYCRVSTMSVQGSSLHFVNNRKTKSASTDVACIGQRY